MQKGIFSLLAAVALALVFTGCNTSSGSSSASSADTSNETTSQTSNSEDTVVVNGQEVDVQTNTFGISAELGTPPERPES